MSNKHASLQDILNMTVDEAVRQIWAAGAAEVEIAGNDDNGKAIYALHITISHDAQYVAECLDLVCPAPNLDIDRSNSLTKEMSCGIVKLLSKGDTVGRAYLASKDGPDVAMIFFAGQDCQHSLEAFRTAKKKLDDTSEQEA